MPAAILICRPIPSFGCGSAPALTGASATRSASAIGTPIQRRLVGLIADGRDAAEIDVAARESIGETERLVDVAAIAVSSTV